VDKLEERGGISAMATVVNAFPGLSSALEAVHAAAPAVRRWLLPPPWVKRVETEEGFEIGPGRYCSLRHPTHLYPLYLSQTATYDMASTVCRALG
jgi:hypothetical protein